MSVLLGRDTPRRDPEHPGGDQQRPLRARERLAERLDRAAVGVGGALEVSREREVVLEREVDHAVRGGSPAPQAVQIIEGAAVHLCSGRGEGIGRGIRASEPDDLMAGADELGNDG